LDGLNPIDHFHVALVHQTLLGQIEQVKLGPDVLWGSVLGNEINLEIGLGRGRKFAFGV